MLTFTVQVSCPVAASQAVAGLAAIYSFLKNVKCGKEVETDLFLSEAQLKTNKFELCLRYEMHHLKTNKPEL